MRGAGSGRTGVSKGHRFKVRPAAARSAMTAEVVSSHTTSDGLMVSPRDAVMLWFFHTRLSDVPALRAPHSSKDRTEAVHPF